MLTRSHGTFKPPFQGLFAYFGTLCLYYRQLSHLQGYYSQKTAAFHSNLIGRYDQYLWFEENI